MKLAFSIASRFLKAGKWQTVFIIIGIAVGVSVQIFIGSLIGGLQDSLVDKTIGSSSHVTIAPAENNAFFGDLDTKITTIENTSSSFTVVTPVLNTPGFLFFGENNSDTLLRGLDFPDANIIYNLEDRLVGSLPTGNNQIIVGIGMQEVLGLSLNDTLTFQLPQTSSEDPVNVTLTVVGFFDFNVATINRSWVISSLATAQSITGQAGKANRIETQVSDVFSAELISPDVTSALNDENLTVTDWMAENQELLSGLQGQSISSLMIQVFVMISVVLGIASVLAITVLQKSKQIGILKAMGILDKDASLIFLIQGFILGIFGAILGVLLGLGLSVMFTTFAINETTGEPVVPLSIDLGFIFLSAGIASLASTLAALVPARKSSKLSVIEVIRNG